MRDFAPEQFDTYAKFLFDNYAKKGLSVRRAVHEEMMKHQNLRYDEAYEEVVARLSESFLRDAHLTEKSRELYNTDKTVWEKIRDGLKDIVDRIKEYFGDLSPDSELGKLGAKMARENQEILDRFVAGVKAASDNAAYIETTTESGGVRMQERYSYDYFISKPDMSIASIDDSITHNRTETVRIAKENAKTFGYVDEEDNPFVHVKDTDSYVKLGTDGLRHSLNRTKGFIYSVTENIGEILSNSIRINELLPKDANAKSTYVLIGTAQNKNGDLYLVRSIVNSYNNELASFDVLYAINTKKELAANKSPRYANNSLSVTNSTISISNLLDYVNRYYPQLLPEDVLKHYGYDARPEGDLGDSALYQSRDDQKITEKELDEYIKKEREEADKRIRELMDKYKQQRHENVVKRNMTKIQ